MPLPYERYAELSTAGSSTDELESLQRLLQHLITAPGGWGDVVGSVPPSRVAELASTPRLSGLECVSIYRRMYRLRLLEVLVADYPDLGELLGEELFTELAEAYIDENPSSSYTLADYGAGFPSFVAQWIGLDPMTRAAAGELASLERLETELLNVDAGEPLALDGVHLDAWEHASLIPATTLRLAEMRLHDPFLGADSLAPLLPGEPRRLALCQTEGRVHRHALSAEGHALLERIVAGQALADAVEASFPDPTEERVQEIFCWFRDWLAWGFFSSVAVHNSTP